ncbi:MAG: inorganic phosphate transporter, partial [Candidatus Rokubacteria bacterium]|nr:inorganic phosphate transporter [Candidatus Rokubacteria bacterium]
MLAAEFVNGCTDAPNAIATVVATRVLGPWQALGMAAVLNTLGAMSGTAAAARPSARGSSNRRPSASPQSRLRWW